MKQIEKQLFLIILLCLAYSVRSLAEDPMKVGKAALDRGDYVAAINAFRDATQDDPKNGEAFYLLGFSYFKADSLDQAVGPLVQGRDLDPNNPKFCELLGDVYMKQKIVAGAINEYVKVTAMDSTNPELYLKLAEAQRKNRQYNDAVRSYINVIRLDSMNIPALTQVGNIYIRAKQWDRALPIYIRLAKQQPDSIHVLINYVTVLAMNEFWKDVIPAAGKILQADPSNSDIQTLLAEALAKTGNAREAISKYLSVPLETLKIDDLISLARAYRSVEKYDSAYSTYQRVLAKDTARCDLFYEVGTTLMKLKKYGAAVSMFDKKVECDTLTGYRFASSLNAAMSLMQLKEFEKAKEYIKKSIQLKSESVQAWQTLAQCNLQLGDVDEGVAAYKKVIELIADDPEGKYSSQLEESYRTVGVEYLIEATKIKEPDEAKKLYSQAFEYLKKALTLNSKESKNYCQLLLWTGQSAQNSNNREEAKKYYCKVISQCPNSKEAKDAQNGLNVLGVTCGE